MAGRGVGGAPMNGGPDGRPAPPAATSASTASSPGQWWARMGPGKRVAVAVLIVVLGLNVTLWGMQTVTGGADPGGPASSSYATGDEGVAAWADLLELRGRTVTRREVPLADAPIDPSSTLVIADPDQLDEADVEVLQRFVAAGGRLVATGPFSAALVGPEVRWSSTGVDGASVVGDEGGAARSLVGSGRGSFDGDPAPATQVLAADDETVVATVAPFGSGRAVAIADSGILHNERLAEGDNAAFALAVVGDDRPVVFLETVHGFGAASGLDAVPARARWALAGLLLAGLVGMWCAGQRFGPPEDRSRRFPPPRAAYVEALAVSLDRSSSSASAAEPLRRWLRRASADRPASPDAVLTAQERAALEREAPTDEDLLTLGRAAARLRAGPGATAHGGPAEPIGAAAGQTPHDKIPTGGSPR